MNTQFRPPFFLKNAMLQSVLASSKVGTHRPHPLLNTAAEQIVDAGNGVRLQGFLSSQPGGRCRGRVILLHGWEGSAASAYIIKTGRYLFDAGFDVFRLNLRDHGESHHLNRGLFFGTLLEESYNGVKAAAEAAGDLPAFLIGFSLGGNFAVRMALRHQSLPMANLKHVICINPPLDPMDATRRVDRNPVFRRHFLHKWKRSLLQNQRLYPDLYDFSESLRQDTCWGMTEILLAEYSTYPDPAAYFAEYTVKKGVLNRIQTPLTLISADDDPIIEAADFYAAEISDSVELLMQPYGGHCGYIQNLRLLPWYLPLISQWLCRYTESQ